MTMFWFTIEQTLCAPKRMNFPHGLCRGQGIGRQVLRKLLEEAGSQEVIMTTISSRIPFYEPEGFERLQLKDVPR